jgi:membrane protein implicated in regulation of membrane protease activity
MVKLGKELTLGVLLVVIVIMVLKPNLLGFLYNNVLGKLIFVAAVVFLSLKHTAAGLLAVVFVAIVASMSGYHGFEGMEVPSDEEKKEEEGFDGKKKKCEGEDCDAETKEGAETQKKPEAVKDIEALLKVK